MAALTNYEVTEKALPSGFNIILITDGKFAGVEYAYTKVQLSEKRGRGHLAFEYNLVSDRKLSWSEARQFKNVAGEILTDIMLRQLDEGSVVYHGGQGGMVVDFSEEQFKDQN